MINLVMPVLKRRHGWWSGGGGFDFSDIFGDIGDVFGDIFGGRRGGQSQAQRGADLRYNLELLWNRLFMVRHRNSYSHILLMPRV